MLKIGIIGLGDIAAKAYLPVISAMPVLEVHLCSRNREKMEEIAGQYRFGFLRDEISSFIQAGIKAAFVHTATHAHFAIVKPLLETGIDVFVDKPVSLNFQETNELVELAKAKNALFMVGFNRRYSPVYQQLKSIENPTLILMQKNRQNQPGEIRSFILDDFIHVVDTLLWLFPFSIDKMNVSSIQENGLLNQVTVQFMAATGETAIGIMNRNTSVSEERLEVMSPEKKHVALNVSELLFEDKSNTAHQRQNDWQPTLEKRGFKPMVEDFIQCVSNKTSPQIKIEDALFTHKICEEIIEEIVNGK